MNDASFQDADSGAGMLGGSPVEEEKRPEPENSPGATSNAFMRGATPQRRRDQSQATRAARSRQGQIINQLDELPIQPVQMNEQDPYNEDAQW